MIIKDKGERDRAVRCLVVALRERDGAVRTTVYVCGGGCVEDVAVEAEGHYHAEELEDVDGVGARRGGDGKGSPCNVWDVDAYALVVGAGIGPYDARSKAFLT